MALVVTCVFLATTLMAVSGKTTTPDNFSPPPPVSTPPSCPQGQQWSDSGSRCCQICAAGTGATGACAAKSLMASVTPNGGDRESRMGNDISSVTFPDRNNLSSRNMSSSSSHSSSVSKVIHGCQACVDGLTFSARRSHEEPCRPCSRCPKNSRTVRPCNRTRDTMCECEAGLFYLSGRSGRCELCDLCPAGWGASTSCGLVSNTVCHKCQNGTYSDVLSATSPCRPCSRCEDGRKELQACRATQDTVCLSKYMDIPPMYRFNSENGGGGRHHNLDLARGHLNGDANRPQNRRTNDDDGGIDVIPLYCAALGAVVVGLLAYVIFVHYRRMRDKRISREPHEDVEYSKASGADSGVFVDPDHHHHHSQQQKYHSAVITGGTRIRDLPQAKKKELEKTYLAGIRGPADWKGLARELGYNSGKIASFESRGSRDPAAPYRHVVHDWSRLEGATVTAFLRALRNTGRHDVVKFLQAECAEQLQPLTATLPQHVV